ncbi:hypothetical protein [Shewanella fidelis]|uniref:Uncharacterized protein n=1 Tax=Shewanella fidelis TaxID=173509 RepID=A0AAW8NNR3_9GAMM|nr:hypothetical protein [Shewanella fidelis]MDR8524879.1 hypothetical protein [Shewanella fidelis]MDW4810950.1 hypothetical protein [Shewanella fidelis]MDW4815271.1 hypothetical protein [Shewanella fidelis]MDW4819361.1 hypothetical protein [Shewanella fidelis]MDW4822961.1 hypothetical protein [Shewanella fidelis]
MSISNAERWLELCERQAQLVEGLSKAFPERCKQHHLLSESWRELAEKIASENKGFCD